MMKKKFVACLQGQSFSVPPIWLMRQAGRYLPEYMEVRAKAGDFMGLVYNPEYAVEVTLQPIRRFGFDAAILFSDILVVPDALGQKLSFAQNHGPKLEPMEDFQKLNVAGFHSVLEPVYEAVRGIKSGLVREGFSETALIGFAGAPWTVACYMVEGEGSKEFAKTRIMALREREKFLQLIDILVEVTSAYLIRQIECGAEAVQIFDSWANVLSPREFQDWVIDPTRRIVEEVKARYPDVPVIGFPRAAGLLYKRYVIETGVSAVGLDSQVPVDWARDELQTLCPVQGNLDPFVLLAGGERLEEEAGLIISTLSKGPHVFNLGHGIHKDTPPAHVDQLVRYIRG